MEWRGLLEMLISCCEGTCVCYRALCVAYTCVLLEAALSSVQWSDAPVMPDPVRRRSSYGLTQGMVRTVDDVLVTVC